MKHRIAGAILASTFAVSQVYAEPITPAGKSATSAVAVQGVVGGVALPVTGTFTASLGGFTPSASGARMTPLSVGLTDSTATLPSGAVTIVSNVGTTNPMYCNVNGVAATTSDQLIGANSWFAFTIPATITTLHCIATGGTTTANGLGGAGLPTGAGGGGGGSSSGGNVTVISPLGTQAIAASVAVTPATSSSFTVAQPTAANLNATVVQATAANLKSSVSSVAGAFVSGSFVAGALADGSIVTMGTEADTAWSGTGSGTEIAILKKIASTGFSGAITSPLGAGAESAGVAVTLSGTKTTASPALPTGGAGGIGWLSDIDANVQAGFETATTSSRVIPATNVTPIDCSGTATGTATNATGLGITTIHGFTIQNENGSVNIGFSLTGTAVIGAAGTFTLLPTGQSPNSYTTPVGFGSNHSVSVVAPSSAVYTCTAF